MSIGPVDIELRMRQNLDSESKKAKDGVDGVNQELAEQDKLLSGINAKQKKYAGNVGSTINNTSQYAAKMNNLNMSIQQVARELPSLAISPQTFILAISNNLPILQDQLRKTRIENQALKASGQSTIPVWKQVAKSLLSPQTALVALITVGSVFGKDIIDWTKRMLNFGDSARLTGKEIKNMTSEIGENLGSEMGKLDRYFDKLEQAKEGTYEYYKAKEDIIDQYGEYLAGLDGEITKLNDVEGAYLAIAKAIREQAREKALESVYEQQGRKLIEKTTKQYQKIREDFIRKFGEAQGDELFKQLRQGLESGKLSKELQDVVSQFDITKYVVPSPGIIESYIENDVKDAIEAISKAQERYNNKIKESRSLLGSLFDDGDVTSETKSLIKEQELLLEQARLMPEATEEEIAVKNKKIKAIEKEIERLKSLGIEEKKQKKTTGKDEEARAEEKLLSIKVKLQNDIAAAELAAMKEGTAKKLEAVRADYEQRKALIAQKLREIEALEKTTGLPATTQRNLINKAYEANEQQYAAEQAAVEEEAAREVQKVWDEVNVRFRTDLENRLADVDKFYQEQYKLLKQNITDEAQLRSAIAALDKKRQDEIIQVRGEAALRQIEFETEIELNRQDIINRSVLLETQRQEKLLNIQVQGARRRLEKLRLMEEAGADVSEKIKTVESELAAMNAALADMPVEKMRELSAIANQAVESIANFAAAFDEDVAHGLDMMGQALKGAGEVAAGIAAEDPKMIVAGVQDLADSAVKIITANKRANKEIREFNYNISKQAIDYSIRIIKAIKDIESETDSIFSTSYDNTLAQGMKAYEESLEKQAELTGKLGDMTVQTGVKKKKFLGITTGTRKIYKELSVAYPELISKTGELDRELAETLLKGGKLSKEAADTIEQIIELEDAADAAMKQVEDTLQSLVGTLGDDLKQALDDAFRHGTDAAKQMTESIAQMMEQLASKELFNAVFGGLLKDLGERMKESYGVSGDYDLTDDLAWFMNRYPKLVEAYNDGLSQIQNVIKDETGIDPYVDMDGRSGFTKGIAQASQDSIDELNGRVMAISGNLYSIRENNSLMLEMERESLIHRRAINSQLEAIAANTAYCRYLEDMNNTLEDINNRGVKIKE